MSVKLGEENNITEGISPVVSYISIGLVLAVVTNHLLVTEVTVVVPGARCEISLVFTKHIERYRVVGHLLIRLRVTSDWLFRNMSSVTLYWILHNFRGVIIMAWLLGNTILVTV